MPELPEVETVRRGLERHLRGARVAGVTLRRDDLRWPIPVAAVRGLVGRRLRHVERRSKYLLLRFDGPTEPIALAHLGMSGRLFVTPAAAPTPWRLHEHWRMDFGHQVLRYVDPRRFGVLDITPAASLADHRLLARLGPEPLGPEFGGTALHAATRRRRLGIKAFLMDARNVVGVGNIYASEACYRAHVRPRRAAWRLTRAECDALARAIRAVLGQAIAAGGTTLRDHAGVDERAGWFERRLQVYGRGGEACGRCGHAIKRVAVNGRSTYYCPGCQR